MSRARLRAIVRGSIPSALPCCTWLSTRAQSRLWAEVIAWKSPVKCRLIASMGTTCAWPPPVAPPLIPNTGPREGSRSATTVREPATAAGASAWPASMFSPSARPTVTVVLPSPAGVGLMPVTRTTRPSSGAVRACTSTLAMCRP